jgi:uncharacterized protein (DUF362 family)/NAD-dependent dihydropyrimidine dehydrogenase PreA subunit
MKSSISLVKCNSYDPDLVLCATRKAVDLIGGISKYVRPKSKVLVKPNLLMAKGTEFAIDTHPAVVRAVVELLKEIDCQIYLGDGPSVWGSQAENVDNVYEKSGMNQLAKEEGIELVRFRKNRWRSSLPLSAYLDECDFLISLPKFKTHDLMTLTGAIKNLFGLVSGSYKTELHKKYFKEEDFAKMLVDIYGEVMPALTIVDGIEAMEGDGPGTSGKVRKAALLLAGGDCVALDSALALIMGLKPLDILTTKEASKRGLGIADIKFIEILGDKLEDVVGKPFQLPTTSIIKKIPLPILNLAKDLIRFYPKVNHQNCTRCNACIAICPEKVMSMKHDRVIIRYSGCISCFCCQEVCPSSAIKVKKSFAAKLIGL